MNLTPHPIPYFMSFKQVKAKGGKIRKGASKLKWFSFTKPYSKMRMEKFVSAQRKPPLALAGMGEEVQRIPMLKYFNVFNIEDIEGIEINIPEVELKEHERMENVRLLLKVLKPSYLFVFEDANRAYYNPSADKLNMPDIAQFETAADYYTTFFP